VPGDDVVQEPVGLVLQTLDFAAIPNGQEGTVKADAIAGRKDRGLHNHRTSSGNAEQPVMVRLQEQQGLLKQTSHNR